MDLNGKRILLIKESPLGNLTHTLPLAYGFLRLFSLLPHRFGFGADLISRSTR